MKAKATTNDNFQKWMSVLIPLYGERETNNMWRWYEEAGRSNEVFENDLNLLMHHYPIQYLTGYTYFYGDKYLVNEETLIPRPETEELVYKILEDHAEDSGSLRIVDLGTGTGCIPISLKKRRPDWKITGLDLYDKTLDVARQNGQLHEVEALWENQDILTLSTTFPINFDIIVSNPPYIPLDEKALMGHNVLKYEPHRALFTKDDEGLEFYIAIAKYGQRLKAGAEIYLEIHEGASQQIIPIFKDPKIFKAPEVIRDMQGKNRILHIVRL